MENRFEWRAEIRFKGTEKEFMKLGEVLKEMPAEVVVPNKTTSEISELVTTATSTLRWPWPPYPGEPPYMEKILGTDRILQLAKSMPMISIKFPDDIAGGIRTAHLHIGDKVALLDRESFKRVVSEVASAMAMRNVDAGMGYVGVMKTLKMLDPTPEPALRYR